MCADARSKTFSPRQGYIPVPNSLLYYREIGDGRPIVILHGGPDFDHTYLLPDMDQLCDSFRLIYYDQRGRGRSVSGVQPQNVSMQSEIEDLEHVRQHFQLGAMTLLGHSWGALLALEYALRHSERVSNLILLNTAPVSHTDYLVLRNDRHQKTPADIEELKARSAQAEYQNGDPDAVADYYRVHFRSTIRNREHLDRLIKNLRSGFTRDGILKARAIEKQLYHETWFLDEYDLIPKLRRLFVPTLVIHGDFDFVPVACAVHVAQALPNARLAVLKNTGHFSFAESSEQVRKELNSLLQPSDKHRQSKA